MKATSPFLKMSATYDCAAYNGVSSMQGRRKGLATRIKAEVPTALPVHCLAHSLNLMQVEKFYYCEMPLILSGRLQN